MWKKKSKKMAFSLIFILLGVCLFIYSINHQIEPNIDAVSRLKAEGIVNTYISETIGDIFSTINEGELCQITYGEDDRIQMVQANTVLINEKIAELTMTLQKKYDTLQPEKFLIPIGTIFGSALLSQTEGGIEVNILPMSVSKCDYVTSFESQGINQTKYKIFVEIVSRVRVLQPFSQNSFNISTKMLIAEVVILGDVPENYVHVPEEDILDVT